MEKIKKFNLEIAVFVKELHSYTQNVNEIDEDTIILLTKTIRAVKKLQINSKFCETQSSDDNQFVCDLDSDFFECRRYIICCLCHEPIPLNAQDFELHIQKIGHKEKEMELQSTRQDKFRSNYSLQRFINSITHGACTVNSDREQLRSISSASSQFSVTNKIRNDIPFGSKTNRVDIPSSSASTANLTNVIKADQVSQAMAVKIIELTSRTETRIRNELQILDCLNVQLKTLDSTLQAFPFGSSTYGFSTDFNIFINAGASNSKPINLSKSLENLFKTSGVQIDFEVMPSVSGNRVRKRRFPLIHKKSNIRCSIEFGLNFELVESSQIIRNCIINTPLGYYLIAYIRSWQNALNDAAAQKGTTAFHFNTYIISVLVIFYLQVKQKFPKLGDLHPSQVKDTYSIPNIDKESLKQEIGRFFEFYANTYAINNHVISMHVGRWQERKLHSQQTKLSPKQQIMREGIASNPANWENCTMYVQDIISPGINITAEISKEEAENFKTMCKLFASTNSHKQVVDEYVAKQSKFQSANKNTLRAGPLHSLEGLKAEVSKIANMDASGSNANLSATASPNIGRKLENAVNVEKVYKSIQAEIDQIVSRSKSRIEYENEIINLLSSILNKYDRTIMIASFGSATYGFGGQKTNLNILVMTGQNPDTIKPLFEYLLRTPSPAHESFELLEQLKANRVRKQQLKILHKKSNIKCVLQFDNILAWIQAERSTQIIRDYFGFSSICKPLVAYVKSWQNVLNDVAAKHGLVAFDFNTYIISVLVIFYLQVNHNLPKVSELPSMISSKVSFLPKGDFRQFVKEFFAFYGNTFQNIQLISVHVGRWQEKRLQNQQKYFSAEQKRMRDGIDEQPENWQNCEMWVQDFVSQCTNVTAEISKQEMNNFLNMCRIFADYDPKYGNQRLISPNTRSTMPINLNQYTDVIPMIEKKIANVLLPSDVRRLVEVEIVTKLAEYIHNFDASLQIYRFGSSRYGIQNSSTNLNMLITTNDENPRETNRRFHFSFERTDIDQHFKDISEIKASRVMRRQISLVHIKSDIRCLLLFERDKTIAISSDIISRYNEPVCQFLITFIQLWQDTLKNLHNIHFEFNTYIISILVIFFLQMKYKLPTAKDIFQYTSRIHLTNDSNFKHIVHQFFCFYGNNYQMWNHVISPHIGQWQERRDQANQRHFSEAKKQLRDGIEASPQNWTNCTMYVQDLVRSDINITAEVSKEAAKNFQLMCRTFAKIEPPK